MVHEQVNSIFIQLLQGLFRKTLVHHGCYLGFVK